MPKSTKPRQNKSKAEIAAEMEQKAVVERQKTLARLMWPFIQDKLTIYDAQTALNACAGFIKYEVAQKMSAVTVDNLSIDLSNQEDSPIKEAVGHLLQVLKGEKAEDAAALLERFGKTLANFAANTYMKNDMGVLKMEDIVA